MPNYLIRRSIVVGGVVAVLATAAVVIGQLTGSESSSTPTGAVPAEWNRIVLLDERTGRVIITADNGDEEGRIESGVDSPLASGVVESSMLITSPGAVVVVDLDNTTDETPAADETPTLETPAADEIPSTESPELDDSTATDDAPAVGPVVDGATTTYAFGADRVITPDGTALTMIAPQPDAERGLMVHGPTGDTIDTESFADIIGADYDFDTARATPEGRDVLVTDTGNFQSVLFSFDRDTPSFFPGLALAVGNDVVVTAQNVGDDATVNVFDHDGELLATGQTSSVRAGMMTDSGVVLVTADAKVVTMDTSSGDVASGPDLDIGVVTAGSVTPNGDRLVVVGDAGTAVIDDVAALIGSYADVRLGDNIAATNGSRCVGLVPIIDGPEPRLTVVDVTNGVVVNDAPATAPVMHDASGCTAAATTSVGYTLIGPAGIEPIQTDDVLVALAPDASMVVVERSSRLLLLDPTAAELSTTPLDVGPEGRIVHFTEL